MPRPDHLHHMAALEAQIGELDAASKQAGKELFFAAVPALMTFLGWMTVRKQRKMMRAALAELEAIDTETRDAEEEPVAVPDGGRDGGGDS